jgi:hypothetical protein
MKYDKLYALTRDNLEVETKELIWSFCGHKVNREVESKLKQLVLSLMDNSMINYEDVIRENFFNGVSLNRLKLLEVAERILGEI